jgi:ATP phosphoribosyltransferase regulatory subunit
MRELIDRKENDQLDNFLKPFTDAATRNSFCRLTTLVGKREVIREARALVSNSTSSSAVDDLENVYGIAEEIGIDSHIDIDLGDAAGLDYYTGLTFKIFAAGLGSALGRGGRYDQLLSNFGVPAPAVGFSICLDWLAGLIASKADGKLIPDTRERTVLQAGSDLVATFRRASELRASGKAVEIT